MSLSCQHVQSSKAPGRLLARLLKIGCLCVRYLGYKLAAFRLFNHSFIIQYQLQD